MSQEMNRRDMLRATLASAAALAVQTGPSATVAQCRPICHAADIELASRRCRRCGRSEKSIQEEMPSGSGLKRRYFYGLPHCIKKSELLG